MKCQPLAIKSCHVISLVILLTWCHSAEIKRKKRLNFELYIPRGYEAINHPNASLNECGYCVGGGTGLPPDHGKDCAGVCFGDAQIDCNGVCGGNAYRDECTGKCLGLDQLTRSIENATTNRDCRGLCRQPSEDLNSAAPTSVQVYKTDQCGICRLSSQTESSSSFPNNFVSSSLDCNNNCQLPGLAKSSLVCGQCVRTNQIYHVLDNCGNCLSKGHSCSCDRDPARCGCIDANNCYIIKQLSPLAIARSNAVNISIAGYFYPLSKQLFCVVQRQGAERIESFPVQFLYNNKTFVECDIQLEQEGDYVFGLGFHRNVLITPPKDLLHLHVFDASSVNISLIGPSKSYTNESEHDLLISFRTQGLPHVPLKCRIVYEFEPEEMSDYGAKPNTCLVKPSKARMKSQKLRIYPSYDDNNWLPVYVEHIIEAPPPKMSYLSSFISEDSLAIIINFEQPINLEYIDHLIDDTDNEDDFEAVIMMCNYLLTSTTLDRLDDNMLYSCRWATRVQLIISILHPLSSDSLEVEIKPGVLIEYGQKYAQYNKLISANISKLSNTINWWSYEPKLAIVGPSEVPECGEFALVGQFSSPRGSTDVDFSWNVEGENVSRELKQHVARNGRSTNLLLDVDMLETGYEYVFTFRATIHARSQRLETSHKLVKHGFESPIVSIYSTHLLASSMFTQRDNMTLLADVKFPDCIYPPQRVILEWSVSDPLFHFAIQDTSKRYALTYTIPSYAMPANHTSSISLKAFIGLYQNQTTSAHYRIETGRTAMKANLAEGMNKITIGSHSGLFTLTSINDNRKRLVYQWSCHETKSVQPCYFNYGSTAPGLHRSPLLITREMQTQPKLTVNSTWFLASNQYLIGLQVFDANSSKHYSETEYTLVNVVPGVRPQVSVGPVYIKDKYVVPYNTQFSTFLIPSGSSIHIRGRAFLDAGLGSIKWHSKDFRYPLYWTSKRISANEIVSKLIIHPDNLMAYGVYHFQLAACSHFNECSTSEISLMAAQSTVTCNLNVDSYKELQSTFASIEKCSIAPSASPITYQLYLEDESYPTLLPLSLPQLSPVIMFIGSPAFSRSNMARLAAKVCDNFDTCNVFYSQPISVQPIANIDSSMHSLLDRARRHHRFGDFLTGISLLNSVFIKPSYDGVNMTFYENAINSTIDMCSETLQSPTIIMSNGHYEMVTNTLSFALLKTHNFNLRQKLLDLIVKFYEKNEAHAKAPSMNSLRTTYANMMNSFVLTDTQKLGNVTNDANYLRSLRRLFRRIKRVAAANMPLGTKLVFVAERPDPDNPANSRLHTARTELLHSQTPVDMSLEAKLTTNKTVSAKVQFGEEIKRNYNSSWDCGQSMPCSSLIFAITIFPESNPYPGKKVTSHKLSPVLDITLHAPNTGEEQNVQGLFKATTFEVTVTGNMTYGGSDYVTKCHYFDEKRQEWRMDDVHPMGIAFNQAACWSGHLSSFVVLRTVLGLNTDYIIGVLVSLLMGVLIFGMMLVFYMQRKKENASVAPEDQPNADNSASSHSSPMPRRYTQNERKGSNGKPNLLRSMRNSTEIQSKTILITD